VGEWIAASGEWVTDRTHAQQFRAQYFKTSAPRSIEEIEKYLGSGMTEALAPRTRTGEKASDTI
jgi:exodeoxyribonuclease V alpha subunit